MPGGGPLPLPHRFLRERKEQSVTASEQAATGALGELGDLGSRCERSCGPQRPRPSSVGVAGRGLSSRRPTRTATSRLPPCTMRVSRQAQERMPVGPRRASERSRRVSRTAQLPGTAPMRAAAATARTIVQFRRIRPMILASLLPGSIFSDDGTRCDPVREGLSRLRPGVICLASESVPASANGESERANRA
jgi:hypothetical protein